MCFHLIFVTISTATLVGQSLLVIDYEGFALNIANFVTYFVSILATGMLIIVIYRFSLIAKLNFSPSQRRRTHRYRTFSEDTYSMLGTEFDPNNSRRYSDDRSIKYQDNRVTAEIGIDVV